MRSPAQGAAGAPIDRLLPALASVRKASRPGSWIARCPAHKDRSPSLSVRELADGRVLLHCHAQCSVQAVLDALGLRMEDLFPARAGPPGGGSPAEPRPFSAREVLDALQAELRVVWLLLADIEAGKDLGPRGRKRAGLARDRCLALMSELQHVR